MPPIHPTPTEEIIRDLEGRNYTFSSAQYGEHWDFVAKERGGGVIPPGEVPRATSAGPARLGGI